MLKVDKVHLWVLLAIACFGLGSFIGARLAINQIYRDAIVAGAAERVSDKSGNYQFRWKVLKDKD